LIEKRGAISSMGTAQGEGFRLRGLGVTRVEALSDVVFGFALTLVGVSLSVPRTFDQLLEALREFPAFALCFGVLILLWHDHYRFFRRYGLEDGRTIFLNSLLLSVVILYVYPLKFLLSLLVTIWTTTGDPMARLADGKLVLMISWDQSKWITFIFGVGYAAVYALLALLYTHAYQLREELRLNSLETFETRERITRYLLLSGIGLAAAASSLALGGHGGSLAGWIFLLIPVVRIVHRLVSRREREKLKALAAQPF
jgi:uncharacterized membrane protein